VIITKQLGVIEFEVTNIFVVTLRCQSLNFICRSGVCPWLWIHNRNSGRLCSGYCRPEWRSSPNLRLGEAPGLAYNSKYTFRWLTNGWDPGAGCIL